MTHRQRILFGKRPAGSSGFEWQLPGGWIAAGETPREAVARELFEETGLEVRDPVFIGVTSNRFSTDNHSISLFFEAKCVDAGALKRNEAGKCLGWEWRRWEDLDDNLFLPLRLIRETGYRPFFERGNETYVSI